MLIYFIIFLLLIMTSKLKNRNLSCFIILLIFMSIRFDVGADFVTYYKLGMKKELLEISLFKHKISADIIKNFDYVGYQYYRFEFLNKILYKIVWYLKNNQLIIFLYSFITLFFLKKGLENEKINSNLSWIFFYSFSLFNFYFLSVMRQGVAVLICFYSYKYIKKEKIIKFLICVLIASLFHKTAIIFITSYFLKYFNLNKKIGLSLTIFSFFSTGLLIKIISLTGMYTQYLIQDYYIKSGTKFVYIIIFLHIFIYTLCYFREDFYLKNKEIINIYYLGNFSYIALIPFGLTGGRTAVYFLIYLLYLVPKIQKIFYQKMLIKYCMYLFCFILLYFQLKVDIGKLYTKPQFVPYKVFWNNSYND